MNNWMTRCWEFQNNVSFVVELLKEVSLFDQEIIRGWLRCGLREEREGHVHHVRTLFKV